MPSGLANTHHSTIRRPRAYDGMRKVKTQTPRRKPITYTPYQASAILTATRDLILLDTNQISRDSFVNFWAGVYSEAAKNRDMFLYNLVVRVFDVAKSL